MIDTNRTRELHSRGCTAIDVLALCDEIDRLRGVQTPPQRKTAPVRVVCVYKREQQQYVCYCESSATDDANHHYIDPNGTRSRVVLTADLPVPEEVTVEAEVENG